MLVDASKIVTMLNLPGKDLIRLWTDLDVGFPPAQADDRGLLWVQAEVEEWARAWGWRL